MSELDRASVTQLLFSIFLDILRREIQSLFMQLLLQMFPGRREPKKFPFRVWFCSMMKQKPEIFDIPTRLVCRRKLINWSWDFITYALSIALETWDECTCKSMKPSRWEMLWVSKLCLPRNANQQLSEAHEILVNVLILPLRNLQCSLLASAMIRIMKTNFSLLKNFSSSFSRPHSSLPVSAFILLMILWQPGGRETWEIFPSQCLMRKSAVQTFYSFMERRAFRAFKWL